PRLPLDRPGRGPHRAARRARGRLPRRAGRAPRRLAGPRPAGGGGGALVGRTRPGDRASTGGLAGSRPSAAARRDVAWARRREHSDRRAPGERAGTPAWPGGPAPAVPTTDDRA